MLFEAPARVLLSVHRVFSIATFVDYTTGTRSPLFSKSYGALVERTPKDHRHNVIGQKARCESMIVSSRYRKLAAIARGRARIHLRGMNHNTSNGAAAFECSAH